mgnify:CR=1 FL=1
MSKWDKLIARICALSKDMRFDELRKVLEDTAACDVCAPEREQPLHLPQGGVPADHDPEA